MNRKNILIVAGEPSGDLHASNLVKDLKTLRQDLTFFGIGGELMERGGVRIVFNITSLALVGFVEVLKKIFVVKRAWRAVLDAIDCCKPDIAILVDYPGFNLALARELEKRSIPVVYYISPQVWAWGKSRIKIIKKCVKKMVVFFKFEEELYKEYGIDAAWIGHPLLDIVKTTMSRQEFLMKHGLAADKTTVAILPGSRELEVRAFLRTIVDGTGMIREKIPNIQFLVAKYPALPLSLYEEAIKGSNGPIRIVDGDTYNVAGACDAAIVASGTATLETAILNIPFLVVYKVNLLTEIIGRLVTRLRFLGIVNIMAKRVVVPELLQKDFTAERIAGTVIDILRSSSRRNRMLEDFAEIRSTLGSAGASMRAARIISDQIYT